MTGQPDQPDRPKRNFYGRRIGKSFRPGQRKLLAERLDHYLVPGIAVESNRKRRSVDIAGHFGSHHPLWLEIGFGSGEHLARLAQSNPQTGFIGCEPYLNGVASLLSKLEEGGLTNVRIHPGDVRDLFDVAPAASVDRVFLLYPDPWPKRRHHRRRFVTPEFLEPLARIMRHGSELRIVTDIQDYARQSLVEIRRSPGFRWIAGSRQDWTRPWEGWEPTRYERKAVSEGRMPIYLTCLRI